MDNSHKNQKQYLLAFFITLLYTGIISVLATFHEVWRDEVLVLTMVRDSASLKDLFIHLHNSGHPPLFHILVYLGYAIFPHAVVLKIVNILICSAAIYLFILKAPFPLIHRIMFICGVLPLYIYPVVNRNYGLSFLLFIITAIFYKDRFRRFIPFSICLFVLMFTHSHAMLVAATIFLSLVYEFVFQRENISKQGLSKFSLTIGSSIIAGGIILFKILVTTDPTSVVFHASSLSMSSITHALISAITYPGEVFYVVLGFRNSLFVSCIIFGLYFYLWPKRSLFIIFFTSIIILNLFFILIYPSTAIRHQGIFYMLMIFILWIDEYPHQKISSPLHQNLSSKLSFNKYTFLAIIFLIQICMAATFIKRDIVKPYSAGKQLAQLIKDNPKLHDAIIVSEPESFVETVPYYLDNDTYLYRENRFGKIRELTTASKRKTNMVEFIEIVTRLKKDHGKEIVILIGQKISPQGPYTLKRPYGATFSFTPQSLQNLLDKTALLANFESAISGESYKVYLLNNE